MLHELKKFKVQIILVLEYNKRNDCKTFHSSAKLIPSDSDLDEAFKSMHKIIMIEIKSYGSDYWIVIETIPKHGVKIFECA